MLVAASVFASCKDDKKDEPSSTGTEIIYYNLSLDASDPSENETTLTEGWNWKSGDQIAFLNLAYGRNIVRMAHNGANFSGSVPSISGSINMGFFYPADALMQTTSDTTYVRISLARQDGVNATNYLAGSSTASINGTQAESSVKMKILNAVANLKFNSNGSPINNITHIELYSDKNALPNQGDYELRTLVFNNVRSGNISVVNAGLNGEARVSLLAGNGMRFGVTVTTAEGKMYVGRNTNSYNIVAGGVYDITFDCEQQEGEAKIGDYFYSDFTHSSVYDESKTCVGIVYALSDKEEGDINPNLASSNHGRVMAMVDASKSVWAYNASMVFDMPLLANYANADGSNDHGYLPFHVSGGNIGYSEGADIKINASLKPDGSIDVWPSAGALSDFNGKRNTESVGSAAKKYPAGYYAKNFNNGGITSWYLPSAGEMALMYALHRSGVIAKQEGFVGLKEFGYWTSTECSEQKVWVLQAFDGKLYANFKTSAYMVRPSLAF